MLSPVLSGLLAAAFEKLQCRKFHVARRSRRATRRQNRAGIPTSPACQMSLESRTLLSAGAFYSDVATPFRDIDLVAGSAGVTEVLTAVDDETAIISLGSQSFNFGGNVYSELSISSNGLISFGGGLILDTNQDLSTPSTTFNLIAPYWDDLITSVNDSDSVLYTFSDITGDGVDDLIVEWNVHQWIERTNMMTFQTILELDTNDDPGEIIFNYVDVDSEFSALSRGGLATVGINNGNAPAHSNQIGFNQQVLTSGTAIRFFVPDYQPGRGVFMNGSTSGNQAVIFDLATNETLATLDLGTGTSGDGDVVITADGTRAFVSSETENKIWVIDLVTLTLANGGDPINVSIEPAELELTDDGKFLLATGFQNPNSEISVISLQSLLEIDRFDLPAPSYHLDVAANGVILVGFNDGNIRKYTIDAEGTISDSNAVYFTNDTFAFNTVLSPDGQYAFLHSNNNIEFLNVSTMTRISLLGTSATEVDSVSVVFAPDGSRFYTLSTNDVVRGYEFNSATAGIGTMFLTTGLEVSDANITGIDRLAISDDGKFLYVTRPTRMVVLDAMTGDVLDEIALGTGASLWGIDIDVNTDSDDQRHEAIAVDSPVDSFMDSIDSIDDVDLYRFEASAGQTIFFDLDLTGSSSLDPFFRIFDLQGNVITTIDDGASPPGNQGAHVFDTAGSYFLGVSAYNNLSYDFFTGEGDQSGESSGSFQLTITGISEPTDIHLTNPSVAENLSAGTPVGTFSTTDPDSGDTFTYSLVAGTGSTDNASFQIVGDQLRTTASFNFEAKSSYSILVSTTDQSGIVRTKQFDISVTDVNDVDLTNLGSGIAANDAATGTGYILYSQQNVKQRFTGLLPQNADHFLAVQFNNGQWQFANNDAWVNFTPTATDVLIAEVNFTADTLTMLRGNFGTISGIFKGFVDTNLVITPNVYNGVSNAGEFGLQGTYITFAARTPLTNLRNGVGGTDNATGSGYMMYSQQNVRTRFSGLDPNNADNFINVRLNGSQWQYDNNTTWVNFTPTSTDILVAALNFTTDTVTLLEGNIGLVNGIVQGYLDGDLAIIANNWAGTTNAGEYRVTGTYITFAPRTPLTNLRNGVGGTDNATGTGYMMYSQQNVRTRFSGLDSSNADNFVNVRLNGAQWQYDNNSTWVNFTPTSTDVLVAALNFTTDTVDLLRGTFSTIQGIASGYLDGDLSITPNNWNGNANTGEYHLTGTFITFAHVTSSSPLNLSLSTTTIAENQPSGTPVGSFSTIDPDTNNTFTYSLVAGTGSADNPSFTIVGNQLRTTASFNYEAKSSYTIRVRTTDQGGLFFEKTFVISVTDVVELPPGATPLTNLRNGVGGTDNATGTGYMMYSQQNVRTRFSGLDPNNADNFVNVRLNGAQWQYDNNSTWVNFTPTSTDILVAALNFTTDTVTLLEGNIGLVNGIVQGYLDGDLAIIANNWNGSPNTGEYHLTGTYLTFAPRTPLTNLRNGVGGTDNATGTGYMMYSQQNVRTRFSGLDPNNADNFVNVRLNGTQWQYDNNSTWVNFTPTSTDRLVATLNFTSDTVTLLKGTSSTIQGIASGYLNSDLTITPNNWNGTANTGEYHLTGTFITFMPTA
ncbi:cadherin domain-containing protein [Lacunimicrobium album]